MGEVEKEAVCVPLSTDGSRGDDDFSKTELKRDHQCLVDDAEPDTFPNKRQAKEVSNDDVRSEVSNPIISPKENASNFHDITSQPAEFANSNRVECDEATSTCSGNSSSEETLSDGEPSGNDNSRIDIETCGAVLTSRVVLEIPEHASTTGIRKITFKLSKRKEDHDNHSSVSEAQPMANGFGGSYSYSGSCEESARDFSFPLDSTSELPACSYSKGSSGNGDFYVSSHGLESKPSKKVVPSSYPSNVKKLLATGILDGAQVKYVYGTPEKVLSGIINGGGYLCGCESCNFSNVLSAYEFEQHAGLKTRHPNNHIYLENGRPIYSIIQELKTAPLSVLDEVIKDVAGSSLNEEFFQLWKASLRQSNKNAEVDKSRYVPAFRENDSPTAYTLLQSESFKKKMYMETVESRKHLTKRPNSYVSNSLVSKKTGEGGTKRRDNDLHKLLFMPNGLPDGAELAYYVKGQRILGGYKQGNGIVCSCCYREVSPSQFEAHAGMAARRQPYRHIYTSNGLTLHDIAISLANGQNITTGDSDDMCAVCGNGGDLILCRVCPRAFHAACLDLQRLPECDWHCPNCTGRKTNAGESSGSGRPIVIRLTRVVKQPEFDIGGCAVCRGHDFSAAMFDERTVMICDQCEKEFHVGCLRESRLCDLKELPTNKWFCCDDCSRIHMALHNLVSFGAEMVPASVSYTIIRKHADQGLFMGAADDDVQWRILSGKSRYPEHLPFLSRSAAIFRECFDPIVAKSGRDLIPVMVYGRNISGQEFGGMYCVVLIVRSIVVSAGLLRIFGREVAELPLVATSREHQGKGYFQALFSCIERLLCSLNVENLVLPAAEDAESIWTRKLGFKKMTEERLSEYLKTVQLTMFNGTSMLEKAVPQTTE